MIPKNKAVQILERRKESKPSEGLRRWISKLKIEFGSQIRFCEMYKFDGVVTKTKPEFCQFNFELHFINTRTKLPSETIFEIDGLPHKETIAVICEVCLSLIRNWVHFAVFYATGQRSPHIRIYDFEELAELNDFEHEEAQKEFWKRISPMLWKYADNGLWTRGHLVQLEFANHWKTGEPFELLFEWLPNPKKEEQITLGEIKCKF